MESEYPEPIQSLSDEVLMKAKAIRQSRKGTYGLLGWTLMPVEDLLKGAGYKLSRALLTQETNKRLDDELDALNYILFALVKELSRLNEDKIERDESQRTSG